jgi:hypothetical protein
MQVKPAGIRKTKMGQEMEGHAAVTALERTSSPLAMAFSQRNAQAITHAR